jgi:hypothetical protein
MRSLAVDGAWLFIINPDKSGSASSDISGLVEDPPMAGWLVAIVFLLHNGFGG